LPPGEGGELQLTCRESAAGWKPYGTFSIFHNHKMIFLDVSLFPPALKRNLFDFSPEVFNLEWIPFLNLDGDAR
jgi:hypothetical protein